MAKRKTDLIKTIKEKGKSLDAEMSFFDHLEVLRGHLIRSSIAIVIFTTLAFVYFNEFYQSVVMGPIHKDFWLYRMMCLLSQKYPSLFSNYCLEHDIPIKLLNNELAGQFTLQMNTSLLMGVVLGIPYLLYELWKFIKPGLKETEVKATSGFVFYSTTLFIIGVLFGYFVITPISISFLIGYIVSPDIVNMPSIDSYVSTVATLTIGSGLVFELPIVVFILSKMGLMTPKFMRSSRRYAIVINLIIAAIVTPTPDILTMSAVALPLLLLYELSISVSGWVEKRKKKDEEEFYKS